MTIELAVVVGAYLLGSIPFGYLVVRLLSGKDVRRAGSQNVGATNALRTAGWGAGLLVFVLDVGKGVVPVLLMGAINPATRWVGAAAVAAVIGHCYPVWLKFQRGQGNLHRGRGLCGALAAVRGVRRRSVAGRAGGAAARVFGVDGGGRQPAGFSVLRRWGSSPPGCVRCAGRGRVPPQTLEQS